MTSHSHPAWSERSQELAGLLSRIALGDRAAFEALYRATSAQLFGVVLRINSDRAQAEEVLQEVFVNIWRAAAGFDTRLAQPMTWLTSVARNRAIDSLRRRAAEPATVSRFQGTDDDEGDEQDVLAAMPAADAGPLELLDAASQAHELQRCLQALCGEQRSSLALAYYQGLSHAEVAEHLAQPLGTVKSWLRRGLQSLRGCLDRAAGLLGVKGRVMDYSRPQLAERLAAEYAQGTLRGGARRRFERLLPAHPGLQDAVQAWQQRLQPLAAPVAPVAPPARVWAGVQRRLFGEPPRRPRWWQRLGLWQGFAGTAMQGVSHIQRLKTVGGVAPTAACGAGNKGQRQQVAYQADYVFYGM